MPYAWKVLSCAVLGLFGLSAVSPSAWANCAAVTPLPKAQEVGQGHHWEWSLPVNISRVAIGDPTIADIRLNNNRGFLITGMKTGTTSLSVWTDCSPAPQQSLISVVGVATQALQPPTVVAEPAAPLVPSQVQTDIRFVDVSRTKLQEVGSRIFFAGNRGLIGSPGTVNGVNVLPGQIGSTAPVVPLLDDAFNLVWGGRSERALLAIDALESSGFAYTLAKPSLVALSGQTASFLAGGEFPVPVPSQNSNNISIEYKEFGVRLTLTPTVVDQNRILLKVAPEVSELDFSAGIAVSGTRVPALKVRRSDTSIALASGESFIISGLLSSTNNLAVDKLPGLGDVPILGAFFRSSRLQSEERELLMIVTPRLVQPIAANAHTPELPGKEVREYNPDSLQLFFMEDGRQFAPRIGLSE